MVVALFSELYITAFQYGFDIALVAIKHDLFAAIQVPLPQPFHDYLGSGVFEGLLGSLRVS